MIAIKYWPTYPKGIDSDGLGDLLFLFRTPESLCFPETGVDVVTGDGSLPRGDGVKLFRDVEDKSTEPNGKLLAWRASAGSNGMKSSCGCDKTNDSNELISKTNVLKWSPSMGNVGGKDWYCTVKN